MIASLPKADLHVHQEEVARLERIVAQQQGRPAHDWRAKARRLLAKTPPGGNRIRDIYGTEFDAIWTCGSSDVVAAATKTKEQVDELLGELDW